MTEGPNKPVESQAKNHSPALIGIVVAIVVVILALFVFGVFGSDEVVDGPTATTADPVVEAETGAAD